MKLSIKNKLEIKKAKWLIMLFQILSLALILVINIKQIDVKLLVFIGILLVLTLISNYIVEKRKHSERYLLLIVNMLVSIGLIMIYRINSHLGFRQLIFYILGLIIFYLVYYFLEKTGMFWKKFMWFYYFIIFFLLAVTIVLGKSLGGATNWLAIGPFVFQPGEFAKLAFVFFIAGYYVHFYGKQKVNLSSLPLVFLIYIIVGLFFIQRELGTAAIFMAVLFSAQLIFDKSRKPIILNFMMSIVGLFLAYKLFAHMRVRFNMWINPWNDMDTLGYQIIQSLFAVSSGGFFGTGIGQGNPTVIPLSESDFIYSSIIEEMGIFMGVSILLLYLILFYRGIKIAMNQKDDFYSIVALCTSSLFIVQSFIVIGGVLKLIPHTGVTLPFMAYGGSSMIASFMLLGVLQYCSKESLDE